MGTRLARKWFNAEKRFWFYRTRNGRSDVFRTFLSYPKERNFKSLERKDKHNLSDR